MKTIVYIVVLLTLLTGCSTLGIGTGKKIIIRDSCAVLDRTLYNDGQFKFSSSEVDALTETNQIKLDAIKRYHRSACPKAIDRTKNSPSSVG